MGGQRYLLKEGQAEKVNLLGNRRPLKSRSLGLYLPPFLPQNWRLVRPNINRLVECSLNLL